MKSKNDRKEKIIMNEDIKNIMKEYGTDESEAEEVQELVEDLGVDEDDAYEIWEAGV